MKISNKELRRRLAELKKNHGKRAEEDDSFNSHSILNITFELKDYFTRMQRKFGLQKIGMGLLNGRESIYLMLADGRRVRVRIEEIGEPK